MSRTGRDPLPDVWGVVRLPARMSGSGRGNLPDVREWSGGPPRCSLVVGRPFWLSRSGREALPDVRE